MATTDRRKGAVALALATVTMAVLLGPSLSAGHILEVPGPVITSMEFVGETEYSDAYARTFRITIRHQVAERCRLYNDRPRLRIEATIDNEPEFGYREYPPISVGGHSHIFLRVIADPGEEVLNRYGHDRFVFDPTQTLHTVDYDISIPKEEDLSRAIIIPTHMYLSIDPSYNDGLCWSRVGNVFEIPDSSTVVPSLPPWGAVLLAGLLMTGALWWRARVSNDAGAC